MEQDPKKVIDELVNFVKENGHKHFYQELLLNIKEDIENKRSEKEAEFLMSEQEVKKNHTDHKKALRDSKKNLEAAQALQDGKKKDKKIADITEAIESLEKQIENDEYALKNIERAKLMFDVPAESMHAIHEKVNALDQGHNEAKEALFSSEFDKAIEKMDKDSSSE